MKKAFAFGAGLCITILIAAIVGLNWYRTGIMHSRCVSIAWGSAITGLILGYCYENCDD